MKAKLFSHFSNENLMNENDHYAVFGRRSEEENITATVYPVYDGFEFVDFMINSKSYKPNFNRQDQVLEINYCYQGRMECKMHDGCLQYVGEGDLFLNMEVNHSERLELPLGFYRGIAIAIDLNRADSSIRTFLPDLPIKLASLSECLFKQDECLLLPSRDHIQHIFSNIYTVPEEAKLPYLRIKIQELLIYLNYLNIENEREKKTYTRPQVEIIKQIHLQITEDPSKRTTIEELAHQYCISPTTLKSGFKGVYGSSISTYMKAFRMKEGARLLRETNKSIAEIANDVGYDSQSKFGSAFKEIMRVTPNEYRKKI